MDLNKKQYFLTLASAQKAKDYDKMLATARTAIQLYPGDEGFLEELHKAQAYYVHEKLSSKLLDQLEEKGDWLGLQAIYLKLFSVFPESKELQKLLKKVKNKIEKSAEKEREAYFERAHKEILKLIQQKDLEDAERACYEVLSYASERREFIHLLARVQHLIDKEIEQELTLYYKTAIPELKTEYRANRENFIRI